MPVLGTVLWDPCGLPFHGLQGSVEPFIRRAHPAFNSFSSLRDSGVLSSWLASTYPEASVVHLASRHVPIRFWNINQISFLACAD